MAADCSDINTDWRLLTHQIHEPHLMKDSSTELTVICAEAGEWGKLTRQLRGIIPIRQTSHGNSK